MPNRDLQLAIHVENEPLANVYVANCKPDNWAICKGSTIFGLRKNNTTANDIAPGDVLLMRTTDRRNGVREIWYLHKKVAVTPQSPAPWQDAPYEWILECRVVAELSRPFSEDFRDSSKTSSKIEHLVASRIQSSLIRLKPDEASGYVAAILDEFESELGGNFDYLGENRDTHGFLVQLMHSFSRNANTVEDEDTLSVPDTVTKPYDASKIKVDLRPYSVFQVMRKIDLEEIDLQPDFQRHIVWDTVRQSRLIESMLIRIPLPAFYLDAVNDRRWLVVDGLQRLSTLDQFCNRGSLKLRGLEFLQELEGLSFAELPRQFQRQIEETILNLYIIQPDTPATVKFTIFYRINTGGLVLTPQEIRHCLFQGKATAFLKRLATTNEFASATTNSIPARRMDDRECVLRFCAFYRHDYTRYVVPDLDGFLSQCMQDMNNCTEDELEELNAVFTQSMIKAKAVFGRYAFRKMDDRDGYRFPINKALFEAWSVCLARHSLVDLESKREQIVNGFVKAIREDYRFLKSISSATGSVAHVHKRFSQIEAILIEAGL